MTRRPRDGDTGLPPAPAAIIPIKLGDVTVGWASTDFARRLADPLRPYLLVAPVPPEVLAVRTGRRGFVVVPQAQITYATSHGGLVTVYADAGRFWSDLTLSEIERRLDSRRFLRLDASYIVNVARIAELVPWTHQRYVLRFTDAGHTELTLSRDVGRRLRAALGW